MNEEKKKVAYMQVDRCTLFAPLPGNQRASLNFSEREKYPRISVFIPKESDGGGSGVISAAFDIETFNMFLLSMEQVARSPLLDVKRRFVTKHWPRDDAGKIKGDLQPSSEIFYGKNNEGVVWISVVVPNRPKIVFEITLTDYHEFFNEKNEPLTKGEGSVLRTIALTNALRAVFTEQCMTFRDTSIPRENKGPYSQRQNSNAGKSSSTFNKGSIQEVDMQEADLY